MNPSPTAVGVFVCQQTIVDKDTLNPSCIGIFTQFVVEDFPSKPRPFSVFATLTDAAGDGIMRIVVTSLVDGLDIFTQSWPIHIPGRLRSVNVRISLTTISFPRPGTYSLALFVDDDLIAERGFSVIKRTE